MKKIFFIGLVLLSLPFLQAQSDTCAFILKGRVIDSVHQQPLSGTLIAIETGLNKEQVSNARGEFEIKNLCRGRYRLHITHLSCEHLHLDITLSKDSFITIYLHHQEQTLDGIVLTVKQKTDRSMHSLEGEKIELRKGNSISSLMEILPGVSLLKTGSGISKPMVNGLFGNRVLIINNGSRQEGQNWGMEHAPEMDAFLAHEVELLTGADALRYGSDGIGAVLLVNPESLFSEKQGLIHTETHTQGSSNGRASALSFRLGNQLAGKIPLYWRAQGSLKNSGNQRTSSELLANTGFREINYALFTGFKNNKLQTDLFFSSYNAQIGLYLGSQVGNLSDLNRAIHSDKPLYTDAFTYKIRAPYQKVQHRLLKWKSIVKIDRRNHLEINVSGQENRRSEFDIPRGSNSFQGPAFDYYINTGLAELLWSKRDFHRLNYKIGVLGLYQSNAYTGRFFIPGFYQKSWSPFLIFEKKFDKTQVEGSLRYDDKQFEYYLWNQNNLHIKRRNYRGLSYFIQYKFQINKTHVFRITHASGWRQPGPNELYANGLHQGLASLEIGDSLLLPERSFKQSVIYNYKRKQFTLEVEPFYQYISNFINLIPGNSFQLTIRGAYPVFAYVQNDAALYGFNLNSQFKLDPHWQLSAAANIVFGDNLSASTPLNLMPPLQGKLALQYAKAAFMVGFSSLLVSRQTRYVPESDYLPPPPAYVLFGLEAQLELSRKKNPAKLGLSIANLSNQAYRNYLNRFRYFTDESGINIQLKLYMPIAIKTKKRRIKPSKYE